MENQELQLTRPQVGAYQKVLMSLADTRMPVMLAALSCVAATKLHECVLFWEENGTEGAETRPYVVDYPIFPLADAIGFTFTPAQVEVLMKLRILGVRQNVGQG